MKTMRLAPLLLAAGTGLLMSGPGTRCHAALYAYNAYAIVNDGSGNTYYDVDQSTSNPDFVNHTFSINFGQSLKLGGQVTADAGDGQPAANGPDWAVLWYKIDNGSPTSLSLPSLTDFGTSGWKVQFEEANSANMAQIGSGLSVGTHTLAIWFQAHDNNQPLDAYLSNGGLNYTASIEVVPEPVNTALGITAGIAALGAFWRRRPWR